MAWLADSLLAAWKFLRSFVTRDWSLEDYPVRVESFPDVLKRWVFDGHPLRTEYYPNVVERQVRCPPWSDTWLAHVINWPEMSRFGDSADDALARLRTDFAEWNAAGDPLPRPGICPPVVEAPAHRIAEHPDLAADFFRRVLNLDDGQEWVSDEADLRCFHREASNDRHVDKILLTYRVDMSDIADGPVVAIFERIVALGAWSSPR